MFTPIYGQLLVDQFRNMAETVTSEYIEDIYKHIEKEGIAPSFEEMMLKVKDLTEDLKRRSQWIFEDYKEERSKRSPRLTKACKKIIDKSVNDMVRTVKVVLSTRSHTGMPGSYLEFLGRQ